MLKSCGWGGVGLVAFKILETAQSPNSSFHVLFDFGLGLGTQACQSEVHVDEMYIHIYKDS